MRNFNGEYNYVIFLHVKKTCSNGSTHQANNYPYAVSYRLKSCRWWDQIIVKKKNVWKRTKEVK